MRERYGKSTTKNGIRVLSEKHPESRAVCLAVSVDVGTRDEPSKYVGMSHFLEHMVFKGSEKRSAFQLVRALEAVGGEVNAYTSREHTTYHTLTLSEDWKLAVDILADLAYRAKFPEKEMDRERNVILQEIGSANDQLEEAIFDRFYEMIYPDHAIGWPILGDEKSLKNINRKTLVDYYQKNYRGANMIVSAAGDIDHEALAQEVEKKFAGLTSRKLKRERSAPKYQRICRFIKRPVEQTHILMGFPTSHFKSKTRFESYFINTMLGGGMTSKLYQSVREKKGLVYSIYSSLQTYTDNGMLMIYAATEPEKAPAVIKEITQTLAQTKSISARDFKLYKTQLRGSLIIGAEDIENRMNSLAVNEMVFGEYRTLDDVLEMVEGISIDSVNKVIQRDIKPGRLSCLVMGPGLGSEFEGYEEQVLKEVIKF